MNPNDQCPYQALLQHLAATNNAQQISELFNALLTDKEQQDIGNRIRIFDLLDQGVTQRDISTQLGVGVATVSRGAKAKSKHDVDNLLQCYRALKPSKL